MRPAAILKPNFHDGYCDSTGFGNAGVCETDDKGSFSNIRLPQSWDDAYQLCAARCLDCSRCNYVSLSLQWNDCSWFNECDLTSLHTEVRGHRSVRVRNATGRASFTSAEAPPQHEALWAHLRSLPRLSPGACWVQRCSAPRNHSLLAIGVAPVAHSWAADAEAHQSYGHIWRVVEAFFQCVVLEGIADAPFAATGSTPICRRVLLPKSHRGSDGHTWALFRELVPLFSGSGTRLSISHAPLVPACPPPFMAASMTPTGSDIARARTLFFWPHVNSTQLNSTQLNSTQNSTPLNPYLVAPRLRIAMGLVRTGRAISEHADGERRRPCAGARAR